ncbi:hypothetical protein MMB232_00080 [Brevundimonas subvibrioides]|uniref:hypothetical protein n=1 Tax=Brevundimonas subvibrioides TaxID=74313 RepID=UPI0032D5ACD4
MAGPGAILTLAWIGAVLGPLGCIFLIRRLLRGRRIFLAVGTGSVGVSILPVRFRAPPGIVILTLKRATGAPS